MPDVNDQRENCETPPKQSPTVVGVGASAGGLAALKTFFDGVPADSGLVFVVVVHLSPEHESHLAELLQPHTLMPIKQVTETTAIEPDHAYIIPPNANISAIDSHLRLTSLEKKRGLRAPIDHFFRTLAGTYDGHAIGVILTGSGSDGALGIKDIKAHGGMIIVQDPAEAEYDGMPQSAIATGMADLILPTAQIPGAILRYDRTDPKIAVPQDDEELPQSEQALLQKVFAQLRTRTDRDFTHYKQSAILRRIARRMQLNYIESLSAYVGKLRESPDEVRALADDLLITVTNFFRDHDVFKKLEDEIIPRMMAAKGPKDVVRVWSAACATGEEAYSIAMLLLEQTRKMERPPQIQIFASDLHPGSIIKAREGLYHGDIDADVSPQRLQQFFVTENGGYRIRKEVRELIVFTPHNLLADPPFSRLDMILCRNLLIYLERDVQRAVVELFHYALNPDGLLLMGSAETLDAVDLFRTEDKKLCLYRKRNVPAQEPRLPVFPLTRTRLSIDTPAKPEPSSGPVVYGVLHQKMVEQYSPPSVLISADDKLVHLSEHAGRFLEHPGGTPTANIVKLVRRELRTELQGLLQSARDKKIVCASTPIPVTFNGHATPVVMHVGPARGAEQDGFALVIFEEREPVNASPENAAGGAEEVHALRQELELTRKRLGAVIEEYETGREEMRSSNEEMQSSNEELRSTLEELETSKEELQSVNEELQTVNQENRHKMEELAQLSSDLQNLLSATGIATLFLDRNLAILRFTPKVGELFNIRGIDRGRPITDLTRNLGYEELRQDAETVLQNLAPVEREVQDSQGRWFLTRVMPYRSVEDRIEGIAITFIDISHRVNIEKALRTNRKQLGEELAAMERLHELVIRLMATPDEKAAMADVLNAVLEIMGADKGEVQLLNVATGKLEVSASRGLIQEFLEYSKSLGPDSTFSSTRALSARETVVVKDVETDAGYAPHRAMAAVAGFRSVQSTPVFGHDGKVLGILSAYYAQPRVPSDRDLRILDLYARQAAHFVEWRRAEEALRESDRRYRTLIDNAKEYAIITLDNGGLVTTWNLGAERLFGYAEKEILGRSFAILFTETDRAAGVNQEELKKAREEGKSSDDRWQRRKDGSHFWASGAVEPLSGVSPGFLKVLRDNSERKSAEESLHVVNETLSRVNGDLKQFAIAASHDLREPLRTVASYSELLIEAVQENNKDEAALATRMVHEGVQRMDQMLKGLLAYTEVNLDGHEIGEPVDLGAAARKAIENLKTAISETSAEVTIAPLPSVTGREVQFIQVMQNLIENAIKYRADRPPKVDVSAERVDGTWRVGVKDNGIGIEPQYRELIFDVFTRLHDQRRSGNGIGLALVRRIVERSGGRIWVESDPGEGSTFYFTLPAK